MGFAALAPAIIGAIGSGVGGWLSGRGTSKLKGAAQGQGYWLQNQGNLVNTFTGAGAPFAWPEIAAFSSWLDQLTSKDPTARMTAAAPQIADITAQNEGFKKSIANLPPGGEKNYLLAEGDIAKSSSIANLLTSEFAQAQAAKGALGQWGVGTQLQGMGEAANIESAAGQLLAELLSPSAAGTQSILNAIQSIASKIPMGPSGGGGSTFPGESGPLGA